MNIKLEVSQMHNTRSLATMFAEQGLLLYFNIIIRLERPKHGENIMFIIKAPKVI